VLLKRRRRARCKWWGINGGAGDRGERRGARVGAREEAEVAEDERRGA